MAARGFTLLEVLVVVVLMAIVASLALPMVGRSLLESRARVTAASVADTLRRARLRAVTENRDLAVIVDIENKTVRIDDGAPEALPPSLQLELYTASRERTGPSVGAIRFFSDGSSTGGEVTVGDGRKAYDVEVDWLTGRVAVADAL